MTHSAVRAVEVSSACCERASVPYRADRAPAARSAPSTSLPRTETAARRADVLARSLCAARDRLTDPLARIAASLVAERAWGSMGFARAADFARENLARRLTVRELQAEVARALQAGAPISSCSASDPAFAFDLASASEAYPALTPTPAAVSVPADLDDDEDRSHVRVAAPRAVVAAFDEAVDLYRAVEGADATVSSFIEALVAETSAAGMPAAFDEAPDGPSDATSVAPSAGGAPSAAIIETALARSTDRWRHLPCSTDGSWGLALGHSTLARLAAVVRAGVEGTAPERVARMKELLAIENEIEIHLGRLLASMGEQDAWNRLRFASMAHYAEERLGLSRTAAQTRARAARALGYFPLLREAYEHDAIGLEAALLVGRVLSAGAPRDGTSHAEAAWVNHATEVTFKRLRDEERALSRFAAFFPACATTLHTAPLAPPAPPDDTDWHASLRREPGIARRRVAALGLIALGAHQQFDPATALIPEPDVFLRLTLPDDLAGRFLAAVEAARRDLSVWADSIPLGAEWPASERPAAASEPTPLPGRVPTPALLAARMFSTRSRRAPAWVGLLAMIEDFVATWDTDEHGGLEDAILIRDGWRCAAPACSSRRNLEVHHVLYRSRGGGDQEWNLVTLCRFHHQRGEHGGLARCAGRAPVGLIWRLGAASSATWYRNERRISSPDLIAGEVTGST